MGKAVTIQEHFVLVNDNGSETGSTFGTTDANWSQDVDKVFRVRFCVTETAGGTEAQAYELRYSTGGAYNLVTGTTPIQTAASAETSWTITDGDPTTNRLSGTGGFIAGEYSEDGNTGTITLTSEFTNLEFCLTIDSAQVSDGNTILLRVYGSGGAALDSYSVTPTITVNEDIGASASDSVSVTENVALDVTRKIGTTFGTLIADTFTDPDSTAITAHTPDTNPAGNSYVNNLSTTIINTNRALCDDSGNEVQINIGHDGGYVVQIDCTPQAIVNAHGGILLRPNGVANYIIVGWHTDGSFTLGHRSGGATTTVDSDTSFTFVNGTTYTIRVAVDDNDNFYATVNGGNLISGNITTHAGNNTIGFKNRSNGWFDNLSVQDLGIVDHIGVSESVSVAFGTDEIDVSASDTINTSESLSALLISFITTSDSVGVAEALDIDLSTEITVSDSIGITENESVILISLVNVSDSIGVTESVNTVLIPQPVVSDSITVQDIPRYYDDEIVVTERVTVSVQAAGTDYNINVSDSISVSEAVQLVLNAFVNVSDSIGITETIKLVLEALVSASDSISVAEAVDLTLVSLVSVNDSISVAEFVSALLENLVSVNDSISIAEATSLVLESFINVSDSVSVAESVTIVLASGTDINIVVSDNISVSESVTVRIGDLQIILSDSVSVSESVSTLLQSFITVQDAVSIAESAKLNLIPLVNVSDSVSVSESVSTFLEILLAISDSITVSEAISVSLTAGNTIVINVSDALGITESVQVILPDALVASVSDSISLSENTNLVIESYITVNDAIAVTEAILSVIPDALAVISNDSVSVSESISMLSELLAVSSDSILISDSPIVTSILNLSTSDSVSVNESVNALLLILLLASDNISIAEAVQFTGDMQLSTSDSVSISESIGALVYEGISYEDIFKRMFIAHFRGMR